MKFPILTTILLAPITAMILIMLVKETQTKLIKTLALVGSGISFVLSAYLVCTFDFQHPSFQWTEQFFTVPGWGIQFLLAVDGLSIPLLLLTSIIMVSGVLVTQRLTFRVKEYFALLLFLVSGAYGVLLSMDMFFFFLFYEVAVIPMFLLVNVWGSGNKVYAANKLTLYLLAGSALVLFGFFILYFKSGLYSFDLKALLDGNIHFDAGTQKWLFILFLIGFGTLAATWPFHSWSPDGYASAPTAASMLHAAVLKTLGAYGILRVAIPLFPEGAKYWQPLMLALGTINILYAAFCVIAQKDLKYIVGYSCVSHMGVVMLGIGTLTQTGFNGAMFQMFSHGIMVALLFACVGYVYDTKHTRNIEELGGLFKEMPRLSIFFILAGLTALGLPGLSGFVAEFLVIYSTYTVSPIYGTLALAGLVLSAIYILRVVKRAFWGVPAGVVSVGKGHGHDQGPILAGEDLNWSMSIPNYLLFSFLLVLGIYPKLFTDFVMQTTALLLKGF
ncbi:MAG: NADH-quinone oxidoreductase subunit M [Candidatus Omnitrophica bacterium]|nr:NADH-quinone oxidoreductase subunit M [Candidatus Omnitrophota bacterium]